MSKFKFIFTNIFLWAGIISSALLIENVGFLTANSTGPLSEQYFYMLLAVSLLSYFALYLFEHCYNKTGVDFVLLALCGILLAGGIVAIWLFKDMSFFYNGEEHIVSFTHDELVRFSIAYGMFIITLYSILFIFSKNHVSTRYILFLFVAVILVSIYATIYSFIKETAAYQELFTTGETGINIQSLFWNSNMFSGTLLMGMCSAIILNVFKKNFLSYFSIIFLYIEILFTCSVLSVITGTALIFAYFLIEIIISWKKHPRRSFIFLGVYLAIAVTLICLFAVALDDKLGPLSKIFIHIYKEGLQINVDTFSGRMVIWESTIKLLTSDTKRLIFGYGLEINKYVIRGYVSEIHDTYSTISSTHNGPLQIFLNYGIIGASLYGLFFLYFLYVLGRMLFKHTRFSIGYLLTGITLLVYSIGESAIFFNSNVQGILIGTLFYLPAIAKYKHERHQSVVRSIKLIPYSTSSLDNKSIVRMTGSIILSIIVAISCLLFMNQVRAQVFFYDILMTIYIGLWILFLTLPYLVALWHKDTKVKFFRLRATINSLLIVLLMGGIIYFYFFFTKFSDYETYKLVFPISLFIIMFLEMIYYSTVKKGSFSLYLNTFVSFKTCLPGLLSSSIAFLVLFLFENQLEGGFLKYIIISFFTLLMFYFFTFAFMFKDTKRIVEYNNNRVINYLHLILLKDEALGI